MFLFFGHKGSIKVSQLSLGEIPLLMLPRYQSGAAEGELPLEPVHVSIAMQRAVTAEQHSKPQSVSVNIVSHMGEQSRLSSERQHRV